MESIGELKLQITQARQAFHQCKERIEFRAKELMESLETLQAMKISENRKTMNISQKLKDPANKLELLKNDILEMQNFHQKFRVAKHRALRKLQTIRKQQAAKHKMMEEEPKPTQKIRAKHFIVEQGVTKTRSRKSRSPGQKGSETKELRY